MKNILLVSPVPPPNGGIATWTVQYLKYFEESAEYSVTLINTAIEGKRIQTNKKSFLDEFLRYRKTKKNFCHSLKSKKYDIIHYNSSCTLFGLIKDYLILHKAYGTKIVYHCRCDLNNYVNNRLSLFLFKLISKKVYKILVLNTQSKQFVIKHTKAKAFLVPNYINFVKSSNKNNRTFNNVDTFVYTGRISKEKGCDLIFKIAEKLSNYNFKLIGDYNCDLSIANCPNNIQFLGAMNHQSLLEELHQKAVFLFLSRSEGFSNSLVEAMMMGLPIIATNVGANQDMIEEKGGILFNIEQLETNIDYCIKEIVAYISDSERLNKSSIFNIEKVKTCYTINKIMPLLLDLYFTTEGV